MNRALVEQIVDEVVEGWDEKGHPRDKDGKFADDGAPPSFQFNAEQKADRLADLAKQYKVKTLMLTHIPDEGRTLVNVGRDLSERGIIHSWKNQTRESTEKIISAFEKKYPKIKISGRERETTAATNARFLKKEAEMMKQYKWKK